MLPFALLSIPATIIMWFIFHESVSSMRLYELLYAPSVAATVYADKQKKD
jgi:hypothetical protein